MSDDKVHNRQQIYQAAKQARIAIVAARFNAKIVDALLAAALEALAEQRVQQDRIQVIRVPGAFELPLCCQRIAEAGQYDAIIALGCVIQGDTPHFDYVCSESARGILDVGLNYHLPVIFGVLTTHNLEQAELRADVSGGENKGRDAAYTALEMLEIFSKL